MAPHTRPRIPHEPIPFYVDGLMDIQKRAAFWARLAVIVSLLVAVIVLWAAWDARIPWLLAIPVFLAPLVPIAAQTRIDELRTKTEEQIRDRLLDRLREKEPHETAPARD